jgi:hypothetical protein
LPLRRFIALVRGKGKANLTRFRNNYPSGEYMAILSQRA